MKSVNQHEDAGREGVAAMTTDSDTGRVNQKKRTRMAIGAGLAGLLAAGAGGLFFWQRRRRATLRPAQIPASR